MTDPAGTERIYYREPDVLEFSALAIAYQADDPCRVILDRTAFYPTSGGQPHDTGWLGEVAVRDVVAEADQIIHHLAEPLELGPVKGRVDAERRHDYTVQHTAQHLISALAQSHFGWNTVSVHFGEILCTIEVDSDVVTSEQLAELSRIVNQVATQARPITISFESAEQAREKGIRKLPDRSGTLRIIEISGIDRCPCGGTHLSNTAQLGSIYLTETEQVRANTRIGFLAGRRTLARLDALESTLRAVARDLRCAPDEVETILPKRLSRAEVAESRVSELETAVIRGRLREILAETSADHAGYRRVLITLEESSDLRLMAREATRLEKVYFGGLAPQMGHWAIALAAGPGTVASASGLLREILIQFKGRGGGSDALAQGMIEVSLEELDRLRGMIVF